MKSNTVNFFAGKTLLALVALVGALASPLQAAQQVYKIVGPDGKVTFSDRPPPDGAAKSSTAASGANLAARGNSATDGLPFELRQVSVKYPVTLYTTGDCVPCASGRALLTTRGIPFTEKTVATAEDTQALQRVSGDTSLPLITIGRQQLKGFSDAEWSQYLDAAGYPPSSVLPPGYRAPAAAPLVAVTAAPVATPPSAAASAGVSATKAPQPRTAELPVRNPAGIKF